MFEFLKAKLSLALVLFFIVVGLSGCATLDKWFPNQRDAQGNELIGTREAPQLLSSAASAFPGGAQALAGIFFLVNAGQLFFYERKKKQLAASESNTNKFITAFRVTAQTIESLSKDPAMQELITKLKARLAKAHAQADVQPEVNTVLAEVV